LKDEVDEGALNETESLFNNTSAENHPTDSDYEVVPRPGSSTPFSRNITSASFCKSSSAASLGSISTWIPVGDIVLAAETPPFPPTWYRVDEPREDLFGIWMNKMWAGLSQEARCYKIAEDSDYVSYGISRGPFPTLSNARSAGNESPLKMLSKEGRFSGVWETLVRSLTRGKQFRLTIACSTIYSMIVHRRIPNGFNGIDATLVTKWFGTLFPTLTCMFSRQSFLYSRADRGKSNLHCSESNSLGIKNHRPSSEYQHTERERFVREDRSVWQTVDSTSTPIDKSFTKKSF
jgi:hypothetical protein